MEDRICGIYIIANVKDYKVYIGQSVNILSRFRRHKEALKGGWHHNEHLLNAYKKYGLDSFRFEILEECPKEELDEREMFYISFFDSTDKSKGYNKNSGGQSRHDCPEETRRKISEAHKRSGHFPKWTDERRARASEKWHEQHKEDRKEVCKKSMRTRKERGSLNGERNGNAVISNEEAADIIRYLYKGNSVSRAAEVFNVSRDVIHNLRMNRSYKSVLPELRDDLKHRYTAEFSRHVDAAVQMFLDGASQNQVAKILGISRNTLRRELITRGIDPALHTNQFVVKEVI